MRRLLAIVVILTGILSVAVGVSSAWGQQPNPLAVCAVFKESNSLLIYDFASGKPFRLPLYINDQYLLQWQAAATRSDKRYRLIAKDLANYKTRLFLAKPDGTFQFLRDVSGVDLPQWAADERKIAFVWSADDYRGEQYISVVSVEDGSEHLLSIPSRGTRPPSIAWSADGQFLSLNVGSELNIYDPNSHLIFQIHSGYDARINWLPTGHRFAFSEPAPSGTTSTATIKIFQADGSSNQQYQTLNEFNSIEAPSLNWSPDGRFLLATGQAYTFVSAVQAGMTVIDTTTGATRLISGLWANIWSNDHTIGVWRIVNSKVNLVTVDLVANTETTLFESEDETPAIFGKKAVFSTKSVNGSKDL